MPRIQTKYLNIIYILAIILLTTIIYYKSINFEFINWDDDRNVYENQDIRSLSLHNIQKIFRTANLKMYQPLTTLSYAIEYKFKGANPHIFHLHNLILHLLNCLLVFIFVFLLIRHSLVSALVAFLFALHPMHVESVAWITERKDVLYSFFYLLSLITYILYLRKNKGLYWFLLSLLFFLLSLFSKSAAITLPLVLFLIDFKEKRPFNLKALPDKIPFLILTIVFGIISVLSQQVFDPTNEITLQFHFYERFILGSYAFFFYLFKLIVPTALSILHPFPVKTSAFLPISYFICFLGFIFLSGYLLWVLIKKRFKDERAVTALFGILFFFVTIGLVIFIPVGSALTAERYTYIPYIGLFIALTSFLTGHTSLSFKSQIPNPQPDHESPDHESTNHDDHESLIRNSKFSIRNFIIYPVFGLWLIFLSISTFYRLDVWKNSNNIWDDVIKKNPNNAPLAYHNRGVTKYLQKDYSGAIIDFTKSIHQHPFFKDAYQYRALSRFSINDFANSIRDFDTALMVDPKFGDGYINRGRAKANFGDLEGAIIDFNNATTINPNDNLPYYNRSILYSMQGKKAEAYNELCTAIKLEPNYDEAYYARGILALEMGNKLQACADFKQAAQFGNEAAKTLLLNHCKLTDY